MFVNSIRRLLLPAKKCCTLVPPSQVSQTGLFNWNWWSLDIPKIYKMDLSSSNAANANWSHSRHTSLENREVWGYMSTQKLYFSVGKSVKRLELLSGVYCYLGERFTLTSCPANNGFTRQEVRYNLQRGHRWKCKFDRGSSLPYSTKELLWIVFLFFYVVDALHFDFIG